MGDGESDEVLVLEVQAIEAALAGVDVAGLIRALEEAAPFLIAVGEKSQGARVQAMGTILIGYSEGRLREALQEWKAFLGPMRPWS
ncbi:hypothetical protein B5P43_15605 [Bacillus sp. SRB_336]|nr:hypothetical protein B5P43_15605 [Bacillus sp. SRB_336]